MMEFHRSCYTLLCDEENTSEVEKAVFAYMFYKAPFEVFIDFWLERANKRFAEFVENNRHVFA